MQAIPAKLQANLLTYGCHMAEEVNRSAGSQQQHTRDSRTNHYLKWYKRMGGEGDPVMPQAPIQVSSSSLSSRLQQLTYTLFAHSTGQKLCPCLLCGLPCPGRDDFEHSNTLQNPATLPQCRDKTAYAAVRTTGRARGRATAQPPQGESRLH